MSNYQRRGLFLFFIIGFLLTIFPAIVNAGGLEIVEVQTRGDGGASDEHVKIKNTGGTPFSLLGLILQSHSSNPDSSTWTSRSGGKLPEIIINTGESAVLAAASSTYGGLDKVWQYTKNWGLSDDGGGMRIVEKDDDENIINIVAEKYWGSLLSGSDPDSSDSPMPIDDEVGLPAGSPTSPSPSNEPTDADPPEPTPPPEPIHPAEDEESESESLDDLLPSNEGNSPTAIGVRGADEEFIPDYSTFPLTLSEFMPDPVGSDDGEWVEIKNLGETAIELAGWKIDDAEGGSSPFQIPDGTIIPANGFLVLYKTQTKIALNNSEDFARLIDPTGEVFQEIKYSDNEVGLSYALADFKWAWTTSPTPSTENIVSAPKPKTTKTTTSSSASYSASKTTSIEEARNLPKDTAVALTGVVIAPPGLLGSQIFYIDGMQIYMYSKNFPDLKLGDKITLSGTLSEVSDETRVKIKTREDINLLENQDEPIAKQIDISEIGEDFEGALVKIFGEVIELASNGFYLLDEDGNEAKIYFKASANLSNNLVKPGDMAEISGIVSQTNTGYRILPRYESDISIRDNKGVVGDEKGEQEKNSNLKYLAILGAGLLGTFGVRYYKRKKLKLNV